MDDRKSFLIRHFGLRGLACFEGAKGVLALLLSYILLRHPDLERMAIRVLGFMHINPDRRFYHDVLQAARRVTPHGLWMFVFGVTAYAAIRFVEAGGLWLEREWAEWFALISGSIYLPWEIYELAQRQNWIRWTVLGINLLIILYLLWIRMEMQRMRKRAGIGRSVDPVTG